MKHADRLDYSADTLNGPGPSNTAWALKWAGPKKDLGHYLWANTNGPKQKQIFFFLTKARHYSHGLKAQ